MRTYATILLIVCFALTTYGQGLYHFKTVNIINGLPTLQQQSIIDNLNEGSKNYSIYRPDTAMKMAIKALKASEKMQYIKGMTEAYSNLAWIKWIKADNYPQMEWYCHKAIAMAHTAPQPPVLANAYYFLGLAYLAQSKFSQALHTFKKSVDIYALNGDTESLTNVYAYLSDVEQSRGQYERAIEYSVKWLTLADKNQNFRYIDIWAELYKNVGEYETALSYYQQAANRANKAHLQDEYLWLTLKIGEIYFLKKAYDSAKHYYDIALRYRQPDQIYYQYYGELYVAQKNYSTGFEYLKTALALSIKANARNETMKVLHRLSRGYKEKGETKVALQYANELLQLANETGARQYSRDAHLLLYQLYLQSHNTNSAFDHLQQYISLKEVIDNELSAQKLMFYKLNNDREKDQYNIRILTQEKRLHQQQLAQAALRQKLLIGSIATLLLFSMIAFRNLALKRRNEKNRRELVENELHIEKLEHEKKQVALYQQKSELEMQALRAQMNPHFIFNCLNAINLFILKNQTESASDYLTKFSRLVRMVLQSFSQEYILLEEELEALKLYIELEQLRFKERFEYRICCDNNVAAHTILMPSLILQPFVENAIWHGLMHKDAGGKLLIHIRKEGDLLICTITDNGIGRQKAKELKSKSATYKKSLGMQLTANRLQLLANQKSKEVYLEVKDVTDKAGNNNGTTVLIKIPIKIIDSMDS